MLLVHCNQALFSKSNKAIRDWPLEVKDSVYELDDILDYWVNQVLRLKHQEVKSDLLVKLQSSFLPSLHPKRTNLHLIETVPERNEVNEWRETTSLADGPQVYGRKHDTNIIVNFLVGYPIVSQGELGKTTLAQLIFNHGMVVNHFESRIWAYVSENFDLMRVTKDIIEAASGCVCENLDIGLLQRKLQDLLQRKGYLLVLDDWLKPILACGGKGASILVTTRSSKVAIVMGTMPPHELSMLSHNICWELFKHQAFVSNEVQEVGLERIGKEIVKKCGGVPLAAKHVVVLTKGLEFLNACPYIKLLAFTIKSQTVSYCAIFPKDEIIRKQELIEFWMANGFISSNEILDAEDVGHGMNLAKSQVVAEEVCCITNDNDVTTLSERIHHISDHSWRKGLCMAELKLLKLKGDLHIKHLEKVKSVMDASKASMSKCELQESVQEILEVLQLDAQQLQRLSIVGYNGVHFPQWMSSSPSLKYLELEDRKVCSQLPELGKLLFLKTMHVYNMIHVKHLFEESYDGGVVFMAIENLSLEKLPNLTRLSRDDGENMFPHLSKLEITECPKLSGFPSLPSINDLHIQGRGLATHSSHPHY
ncbi:Disease resistance protein RGA2 [Glycine soja]